MTNDLKSALTIVYGDIVAVNEKADTNTTNIETNTSNIETLQTQVSTNTTQLSTNTSNIETLQQEVANLKASASGVLYNESEVSGVGYELSVSENALPYGTIDIVGGMSYEVLDDETSEYIIQDTPITSIVSKGANLFDESQSVVGAISASNGTLVEGATNYNSSDYIEINANAGIIYLTNLLYSSSNYGCAFYDSDETFISGSGAMKSGYFDIPTNAKYFRFSWQTSLVSSDKVRYIGLSY